MTTNRSGGAPTADLKVTFQDFHFVARPDKASNALAETQQDVHFKAVAQDFHFKAIAQDFHRSMSVPDAPEVALPAVQADSDGF